MGNRLLFLLILVLVSAPSAWAAGEQPVKPGPKDKCPVCGMFVAKYPDFIAVITFGDKTRAYFDGVKDMMKYYFNLQKFNPSKTRDDIARIHVTDYYSLGLIDGFKAFYVTGSDIYGPMGKELIPFEKEEDAKEFLKDHKGKALLRFQDITDDLVKGLD
ncbi:MAG: nitrous oxide reductase accessory protein NosL [Desulfobacterota bacterium]|jgi:nitrous oxide reductase accessory protein NosL|nr:nitrous oxide reductase accessory protein NosL [Thermodesulfobacteriota bacterium]